MPYTLRLATPATRTLVVEALRSAADQRTRVARGAARKVADAKADGRDVRSQAVKVTAILAEADELATLATELEAAPEVAVLSVEADGSLATLGIPEPAVSAAPVTIPAGDDGTSAEAQRLAALAGLADTPLVDPEAPDVDTLATVEDEPANPEEIDLDEYR